MTPNPEAAMSWKGPAVIFAAFIALLMVISATRKGPSPAATVETYAPAFDKSPEAQAKRKGLIDAVIAEGLVQSVDMPGATPHIRVRRSFYALDFSDKEKFARAVYAYYFDGNGATDIVTIYDARTGKSVGAYGTASGLSLTEP